MVGVPVNAGLSSGALVRTSPITVFTAFGVAASASLSLSVALLNLTIPFFVRLASSREITSAISSARFAASSALVANSPAAALLCAASDALVSDVAAWVDASDADDEAAAAVLAVSADAALADASPAFVVAVPALLSADAADEAADQNSP